jgi:hypothetical protein
LQSVVKEICHPDPCPRLFSLSLAPALTLTLTPRVLTRQLARTPTSSTDQLRRQPAVRYIISKKHDTSTPLHITLCSKFEYDMFTASSRDTFLRFSAVATQIKGPTSTHHLW